MKFLLSLLLSLFLASSAGAACVVNAVGAKAEAAGGNLTLLAPASPATNDIWIALVQSNENDLFHGLTGWTNINNASPWGNVTFSAWYFRYAGTIPNLVVTNTGTDVIVGGILQLRGCDTSGSPVDTLGAATNASNSNTATFATITPATSNTLLLAVWAYADDLAITTGPSGFTEAFAYTSSLGFDSGVYAYAKAHTSGATGAFTATMTAQGSDDENSAYLIAIAEDTGGGGGGSGADSCTGLNCIFVAVSGGFSTGACTTQAIACTFVRAQAVKGPGDHVVFLDGVHNIDQAGTDESGTSGNYITYRCYNALQCTIKATTTSSNTTKWMFNFGHSWIWLRDIILDGNNWTWDGLRINKVAAPVIGNIKATNVQVQNSGGKSIGIHHYIDGVTLRWISVLNGNRQYTGGSSSTALYLGSASEGDSLDWVENVTIQAVTVDMTGQVDGQNIIDFKGNTRNFVVDHLIADPGMDEAGNEGCIQFGNLVTHSSSGHTVEDIVIKNTVTCGAYTISGLKRNSANIIRNSVFRDSTTGGFIGYRNADLGLAAAQITNNKMCGLVGGNPFLIDIFNKQGGSATPAGITLSGNSTSNEAASVCDTEETRIKGEFAAIADNPTNYYAGPTPSAGDTEDDTHSIVTFAFGTSFTQLTNVDATKFSLTEDGVARAISAALIVGTSQVRLTHAALTTTTALKLSATAGAVFDNANVLGLGLIYTPAAAFNDFTIVNDLPPVAATYPLGSGGLLRGAGK